MANWVGSLKGVWYGPWEKEGKNMYVLKLRLHQSSGETPELWTLSGWQGAAPEHVLQVIGKKKWKEEIKVETGRDTETTDPNMIISIE